MKKIEHPQDYLDQMDIDSTRHVQVMLALMEEHAEIAELLKGRAVHYLDVPMYGNVGDLLIMHGTEAFFKKHKVNVTHRSTYFNYDCSWASPETVIVFQGGGNIGDIYPYFQNFREDVIRKLPNNRIVILPQTIHFDNDSNWVRFSRFLSTHRDLHLCVRDQKSFLLAQPYAKNLYLKPDMAHHLFGLCGKMQKKHQTLYFMRRDGEAMKFNSEMAKAIDWADVLAWNAIGIRMYSRTMKILSNLFKSREFSNVATTGWMRFSMRYVDLAKNVFGSYDMVISDRLHAHILCCIMGIRHVVLDNSYGKNSSYVKKWTESSPLVTLDAVL